MSSNGIFGGLASIIATIASWFTQDVLAVVYSLLGCVCIVYSIVNFAASTRAHNLKAKIYKIKIKQMEGSK